MADKLKITADLKKAAVLAWHEAQDEAARFGVVKQYPFLSEIYALAGNYLNDPAPASAPAQAAPPVAT